jgi:hypothetical protein
MKASNEMVNDLELVQDYVRTTDKKIQGRIEPIKVLSKVIDQILEAQVYNEDLKIEHIKANAQIIAAFPDFFDSQFMMTGPTALLFDRGGRKFTVSAASKIYNYKHSYDLGAKFDLTIAVKGIETEFADDVRSHLKKGYIYCPFMPLQIIRACDQSTFEPQIHFKSRYGIIDPQSENGWPSPGIKNEKS